MWLKEAVRFIDTFLSICNLLSCPQSCHLTLPTNLSLDAFVVGQGRHATYLGHIFGGIFPCQGWASLGWLFIAFSIKLNGDVYHQADMLDVPSLVGDIAR